MEEGREIRLFSMLHFFIFFKFNKQEQTPKDTQ